MLKKFFIPFFMPLKTNRHPKFSLSVLSGLVLMLVFSASCNKEPGEGGGGIIKGKLYSGNFHSPEVELGDNDTESNERVFITYGNSKLTHDDDYRTSHDGSFEFRFLRKGTYTIYAYSLDTSLSEPVGKIPVIRTVEIGGNKDVKEIDDMMIYREADDNGTSTIRGKVFVKDYNSSFSFLRGEYYGEFERVFIIYGNGNSTYDDDYRTSHDGSYRFSELRKGTYTVFVYSKDSTMQSPSGDVIVSKEVEITDNNQVIELEDLVIFD